MATSRARLEANRRNARLHATRSKTKAGKVKSRKNSTKHGLSGTGVFLTAEDRAEVDRRTAAKAAKAAEVAPNKSVATDDSARSSVPLASFRVATSPAPPVAPPKSPRRPVGDDPGPA